MMLHNVYMGTPVSQIRYLEPSKEAANESSSDGGLIDASERVHEVALRLEVLIRLLLEESSQGVLSIKCETQSLGFPGLLTVSALVYCLESSELTSLTILRISIA